MGQSYWGNGRNRAQVQFILIKAVSGGRETTCVGIPGQSSESLLLCSAVLTLPFLDAPLAPRCPSEVCCQHLNALVLERVGLAIWDEGRGCNFSQNDVCLLAVTAMTVSRNMLTCRHDGVETLNIFSQWLELDICRWLRCGDCSEIGTRDHNLSGIECVKKAKRIGHVVSIRFLTVRRFSLHHNFVCRKMITCVCAQLLQTMQRLLPGLVKVREGHPTSDHVIDIKDSLQSRVPHGTA